MEIEGFMYHEQLFPLESEARRDRSTFLNVSLAKDIDNIKMFSKMGKYYRAKLIIELEEIK